MRLIDADELRKRICKGFTQNEPDENPMVDLCECLADFISIIDAQPTAYDVDKVVEELKGELQRTYYEATSKHGSLFSLGENTSYQKAIEIVKAGGTKRGGVE